MQTIPTHIARLNGAEIQFAASEYEAVIPRFVAEQGGGVPQIAPLAAPAPVVPAPVQAPAPVAAPVVRGQTVNEEGRLRSALDDAGARAGGFTPRAPLYSRGTMVIDLGVDNARAARAEYDAMPRVEECVQGFVADVAAERRAETTVVGQSLRMDKAGRLVLPGGERLLLNERAFGQFCQRFGTGGGDYLAKCWPELRAINLNRWAASFEERYAAAVQAWREGGSRGEQPQPTRFRLRTRTAGEAREVFAAVGEHYTAFDVDKVAEALSLAMPSDARLRVEYDGFRARFDVLFHSTVQPEDFVAGEFFRAGITIRTDDTGGGSLRGSSFVEQNLCLNLIVIDKQVQPLFALKHMGSVERLADEFRAGLRAAQDSLDHFLGVWGYARRDDLVVEHRDEIKAQVGERMGGLTLAEFFDGFAGGLIERELVPLRARHGETVRELRRMFLDDVSSDGPASGRITRAGVVNALTRYAHRVEQDPFRAEELERAASGLLWPGRAGRLPEIPFVSQAE